MLLKLLKITLNATRKTKRIITVVVDSFFIVISFWASLVIRVDNITVFSNPNYWLILSGLLPISILIFVKLGLYRAVLRYMSSQAVWAVVAGTMLSTAALVLISFFSTTNIPRTMPLIYCALILLTVGGARLLIRALVTQFNGSNKQPVVIYGAGSAGRQLATGIVIGQEYYVSAFIDDDTTKYGSVIQGIPVISLGELKGLIDAGRAIKVLLALPSASRSSRNRIINSLQKYQVRVQSIPGIKDVIEGNFNASELIEVEIDDLLGREPVTPLPQLMAQNITGKNVMVSGAGGSIGSELCRQIIKFKPNTLVLFELSEFALYQIEKELSEYIHKNGLKIKLYPLMGSVQRINRVENVITSLRE
jgi:FlaA1/EpsC-like NDP-sugar epimerase